MNVTSGSGIKNLYDIDISQLSIEDSLTVVNMAKMVNCEARTTAKLSESQEKNKLTAKINTAYASMQNLLLKFDSTANPDTTLSSTKGWSGVAGNLYASEINTNDALKDAGLLVNPSPLGLTGDGLTSNDVNGKENTGFSVDGKTTKAQVESALATMKSKLDNLSTISQTDMIELQSLTGKYTAAADYVSGNVKKFQDLNNSIIRNM